MVLKGFFHKRSLREFVTTAKGDLIDGEKSNILQYAAASISITTGQESALQNADLESCLEKNVLIFSFRRRLFFHDAEQSIIVRLTVISKIKVLRSFLCEGSATLFQIDRCNRPKRRSLSDGFT